MPRWLLPLVAVLALCGRAVTAFAAAGWVGDTSCCCPSKKVCKCHDHEGKPHPDDTMKKCGGDAHQVAPDLVVATQLPVPAVAEAPRVVHANPRAPLALVSILPVPPEPPPI